MVQILSDLLRVQFFRYLLVGGLTAVVHLSLLAFLLSIKIIDYRISVSVAYITGAAFNFFASRRFTFRSQGGFVFGEMSRYIVLLTVNYVLTILTVYISVDFLNLSPILGGALAIVITIIVGFTTSRLWVFGLKG